MSLGLIGKKIGMSRIFTEEGESIPVTVVQIPANCVTQIKTIEADGYTALQLSSYKCNPKKLSKSVSGHFAKVSNGEGYLLCKEFRVDEKETEAIATGEFLSVGIFESGQKVKVTAKSKGKGFAGVIKRHNFRGQDRSHGNSLSHRVHGSVGQCQTPGKVFKGKKMAGQLGNQSTTLINAEIVKVDKERDLLMVKGSVPGAPSGEVIIQHMEPINLSDLKPPSEEKEVQSAD